jgi:hypothetical protein
MMIALLKLVVAIFASRVAIIADEKLLIYFLGCDVEVFGVETALTATLILHFDKI